MKFICDKSSHSWLLPLVLSITGMATVSHAVATSCPDVNTEALQWLDKMSRSAQEVSYSGVVTFQLGDDMEVMQISHSVTGLSSSESLTQLTGQGAQVKRVEHPLNCIHPGHKLLRLGSDFSTGANDLGASACGISSHYNFKVAQGERVAGRQAVRIIVSPKDMYRYGYIMELDKQTGLLLKTRTVGRGGKVLERFQFANLSYSGGSDQPDNINVVHQATHPSPDEHQAHAPASRFATGEWELKWLPGGFLPTDLAGGGDRRRTFTDGMAVFSVFLEMLPQDIKPGEGVVHRGGTTSYTRGLRMNGKPALVTVIGEVPLNTARMVADSVRWVQY